MKIFNTKHQQKSAIITAIILLLLIFGILNYGMQYLDPPEEYGVAINFGNSNKGSGKPVDTSKKTTPKEVVKKKEVLEEVVKETPIEKPVEKLITNNVAKDVPIVEKVKEPKKASVKKVVKETIKPIKKTKPKPSKEAQDALNKLLSNNADSGASKGEGDDAIKGVKGKVNGDSKSSKYYGNTGTGSGGNYNLAGRKALSKPKQQPDCQEEGIVVVQITVNNKGEVVKAIPGVKGSTNTAPCLLKPAKLAALSTKWNVDLEAPKTQTGTIIYKFSLTK
ncbi:energy transducer TonB [uncultured Polaribacter sp.]|uniref:energy transducer TonB n=1 Tax=uncultured Polaribacter sp. TaxID=174711 RepID=UPI002629EF1B|nr:energy transducer TonB [uncultured Polaribacter sp.]